MKRKRFAQGIYGGVWPDAYFESIPPGWRFRPTKRHLLQYLKAKILNKPLPGNRIPEVDLYAHHPQDLVEIKVDDKIIGYQNSLDYYEGKNPNDRTDWKMHELRMTNDIAPPIKIGGQGMKLNDWVLCKVYENSRKAKIREEEEEEEDQEDQEEEEPQYNGGVQITDIMMREPPLQQSYTFTNQVLRMPFSDEGMVYMSSMNGNLQPPLMQSSSGMPPLLQPPLMQSSSFGMPPLLQPPLMQSSSFGMPPLLQPPLMQSSSFGMPPLRQAAQNGTLEDIVSEYFRVKEKKDDDVAVQLPEDGCTVAEDEDVVTVLRPDKGGEEDQEEKEEWRQYVNWETVNNPDSFEKKL
ncbi:hypothetical protein FH972_006313 [Carpinus fangiana]|uniref:NAC domain-containing protein n=1 Tax=Carpinus fangiana TaxID=176857 RepID=A0A5N6QRW7_9ROSI|nr:hypothetical protein FH972_006313 [Carpinus fangiana]